MLPELLVAQSRQETNDCGFWDEAFDQHVKNEDVQESA
jgi:hypothetical protein